MILQPAQKKVGVLGFGIEGRAATDFLLAEGATVVVYDEKEIASEMRQRYSQQSVVFVIGPIGDFSDLDVIIRSPGIRPDIPALQSARQQGIMITSATQIFLERAQGTVIGVTGTKGKGSTSQLLYNILASARANTFLGGNIGNSPLTFISRLNERSITVLELSSFQLGDVTRSPQIAVVLMVTSEHLDYHLGQKEYIAAKCGLTKFQTAGNTVIYNPDYPASVAIAQQSPGRKLEVSPRGRLAFGRRRKQ